MRRREFIKVIGGATATAWPLAARAQQPAMPVIGLLHPASPDTFAFAGRLRGLRQGLKDTGYVEGENVAIEYRWAENQSNRLPELSMLRDLESAARAMGLQIRILNVSTSREINAAFASFVRDRPDALFVGGDLFFTSRRVQFVNLASRHAVPAAYSVRDFAEAGGLMSYGPDVTDAWRQVGVYTGRILKGAKPSDLPVMQASKFELVINSETTRMLGLTVPPQLLARADEVIE
jgi:hypothetical protein